MPSLEDTYVDNTPSGVRLAVALALVLAGSVVAALGLVDAAAGAFVALGVPAATAGRLGVVAGGLVLPVALAALHAVVPATSFLRRVAAAGVTVATLGLVLTVLGVGALASVAYGVGVLAALWSLVAAATAAVDRPATAATPASASASRPPPAAARTTTSPTCSATATSNRHRLLRQPRSPPAWRTSPTGPATLSA